VLSFIVLGAKCRFCQKTISWQYPIVELITAVLFGVSSVFFHQEWFRVLPSFVFVSFVVILAASDLKWKLLPHVFNNIFILAGMIFTKEGFTFSAFFTSASNFILIGSILYGITQIIPKGLGGGDIKMGAALAIWLGFSNTLLVLFLSFALGSLVMLPLLWMKKVSKKSMIPFGPFLTMAGLFVWFFPELTNQLGVAL
jgi:prepilin signal peptidase PulO-like enzyme (type II secretory pathway)